MTRRMVTIIPPLVLFIPRLTSTGVLDLFGPPSRSLPVLDDTYRKSVAAVRQAQAASLEGAQFSEIMSGYLYMGNDIEDYVIAANAAKGAESSARFFLSVHAWDTDTRESFKSLVDFSWKY